MVANFFACILLGLVLYLVSIIIKRNNYWKRKNVPYLKPTLLFGNYKEYITLQDHASNIAHRICKQFPNEPYVGTFYGTEPALIVQDPDLIALITSKEFNVFNGREISSYTHKEIITSNIFFTFGERWKMSNQAVSPLFSLSKLKNMFHLIEKCYGDLEKMLDLEVSESSTQDVKILMADYTMDCICSCVLGVNANTMDRTVLNNPFKIMGHTIFEGSKLKRFSYIVRTIWPAVYYGLGLKAFPSELSGFFLKLFKDICDSRGHKPSSRNDIIDHFLTKNNSDDFVTGLLVALFGAGYETSASTLSYTLYELAKNEDVQRKAIAEVDAYLIRNGGKISYECVNELRYLDACTNEAMRMYPVLKVLTREVMEDYTLPTGLKLEKGLRIHIPVWHLHHHPDYFTDPYQFRPERFFEDTITPFTYLPFGEGRRLCVGKRFAKMQMLPCLVALLKKYRVTLAASTPAALEFQVGSIITQMEGPIPLKFIPREDSVVAREIK